MKKFLPLKKSSFMIYRSLGLGWQTFSYVPGARRHVKRIQRRGLFGDVPKHRYWVEVTTSCWFFHTYKLV